MVNIRVWLQAKLVELRARGGLGSAGRAAELRPFDVFVERRQLPLIEAGLLVAAAAAVALNNHHKLYMCTILIITFQTQYLQLQQT